MTEVLNQALDECARAGVCSAAGRIGAVALFFLVATGCGPVRQDSAPGPEVSAECRH